LYQSSAEITAHQNLVTSAAAVGDKSITVTLGANAVSADEYKDGYVVVTANAAEGQVYTIAGHPAAASQGSLVLTLDEPVVVAITANSTTDLVRNPNRHVVVAATTETGPSVGVALHAIGASEYGWLQTHGPGPVRAKEALVVGLSAVRSTVTAGAVSPVTNIQADNELNDVGYAITGIADSEFGLFYWRID
jgi:hypothetical protein